MSKDCPLVSIGMPVRNCSRTLHMAINSLILQTYPNWEVFLIDDGSSDQTLHIAQNCADPRIKAYGEKRTLGLPARLNQAITMSWGKYFARMDGDDVAYPTRLERQVNYLEAHPEVDLAGTWVIVFDSIGTPLGKRAGPKAHGDICAKPFAGFPIAHPTYVGRLEWFRRYRYNETVSKSQDQELLLRSYRFSRFANIPDILLGYREEKIDLKKILSGRWYFARVAAMKFFLQWRLDMAIRASLEQGFKGIADCLAVGSGLNYRLLRQRAQPITDKERRQWEQVWQLIQTH